MESGPKSSTRTCIWLLENNWFAIVMWQTKMNPKFRKQLFLTANLPNFNTPIKNNFYPNVFTNLSQVFILIDLERFSCMTSRHIWNYWFFLFRQEAVMLSNIYLTRWCSRDLYKYKATSERRPCGATCRSIWTINSSTLSVGQLIGGS